MISILYNLLLHYLVALLSPFGGLALLLSRRTRKGISLRLGAHPPASAHLAGKPLIWIHGASVGEIGAAVNLADRIKEDFPDSRLMVSALNPLGGQVAREKLGLGDAQTLLPLDLPFIIRHAFSGAQRPRMMIILEAELWPNLLWSMKKMGVPVVYVNGRISKKAHRRFRFFRPLTESFLVSADRFFMQTKEDGERIIDLGAPKERVKIIGNLKDDRPILELSGSRRQWREELSIEENTLVLMGASLHLPEVEGLIDMFLSLAPKFPRLALLLAPRHLHKLQPIGQAISAAGLSFKLRTSGEGLGPGQIMIVDTMGELKEMYAAADLVFVGGTMVKKGGHNLMEGAVFSRPILFGPSTENYRSAAAALERSGGGRRIRDWDELEAALDSLLSHKASREEAGREARKAAESLKGALERLYPELRILLTASLSR